MMALEDKFRQSPKWGGKMYVYAKMVWPTSSLSTGLINSKYMLNGCRFSRLEFVIVSLTCWAILLWHEEQRDQLMAGMLNSHLCSLWRIQHLCCCRRVRSRAWCRSPKAMRTPSPTSSTWSPTGQNRGNLSQRCISVGSSKSSTQTSWTWEPGMRLRESGRSSSSSRSDGGSQVTLTLSSQSGQHKGRH